MNESLFDHTFFEKLNTVKMSLNMRLSQGMSGSRKSSAKGSSVEFSDFREYIPGDDIRRIDWNAYGRTDKLYIKQFMEEKEGLFRFFLDTSYSMEFGEKKKSVMALRLCAALSYIIMNNLDRVFINEMRRDHLVKGKGISGGAAFPHLLKELLQISFAGDTHIAKCISTYAVPRGGVSLIVSDFLDPDGIEDAVRFLVSRKQTVVLIQVLAREEIDIDYEGTVNILDMETNERLKITMSNAAIRDYGQRLADMKNTLTAISRKYGAHYISVVSDEDIVEVMLSGFSGLLAGITA